MRKTFPQIFQPLGPGYRLVIWQRGDQRSKDRGIINGENALQKDELQDNCDNRPIQHHNFSQTKLLNSDRNLQLSPLILLHRQITDLVKYFEVAFDVICDSMEGPDPKVRPFQT